MPKINGKDPVLVVIQLTGGLDFMNTIIPYTEGIYYDARPTVGIPRESPNGYYVKNVLWTQYFTPDGASFHDNYWSSNFGGAGSHGCLGLNLADSKWLWDWARIGTPVVVNAS